MHVRMFKIFLLVVWYQRWPVCSWLEWHRSSCDFSWNACRLCREPLGESTHWKSWSEHGHTWLPTAWSICMCADNMETQMGVILPCFFTSFSGSDTYNRVQTIKRLWQNTFPCFNNTTNTCLVSHLWGRLHIAVVFPWKSWSQSSEASTAGGSGRFVTLSFKAVGSILGTLKWYVSGQGWMGGGTITWHRLKGEGRRHIRNALACRLSSHIPKCATLYWLKQSVAHPRWSFWHTSNPWSVVSCDLNVVKRWFTNVPKKCILYYFYRFVQYLHLTPCTKLKDFVPYQIPMSRAILSKYQLQSECPGDCV